MRRVAAGSREWLYLRCNRAMHRANLQRTTLINAERAKEPEPRGGSDAAVRMEALLAMAAEAKEVAAHAAAAAARVAELEAGGAGRV